MTSKIWSFRYELIYWLMLLGSMGVEWAASKRVQLLPRAISWIPDILLLLCLLILITKQVQGKLELKYQRFFTPVLVLIGLSIISLLWNRQPILNFINGFRIYFKYLIWAGYLLLIPGKIELRHKFILGFMAIAILQIPLVILQKYRFDLNRDIVSGTIAGSQALSMILVIAFFYFFSYFIIKGKNQWFGFAGLAFLIPSALGESKAMFLVFPVGFIVLLVFLRKWITPRFALIGILIMIGVNLLSVFLYPPRAQEEIISWFQKPINIYAHQARFSKLSEVDRIENTEVLVISSESIPEGLIGTPKELEDKSMGRRLGRFSGIEFALKNCNDLSDGGWLLGAGIGSTSESGFKQADGLLYTEYPTFELNKVPLTMIILELGLFGVITFVWLAVELLRVSLRLISSKREDTVLIGILGIAMCFTILVSSIYMNYFNSDSFMFSTSTIIVLLLKSKHNI